jgi:hypothetical protein
MDEMRAIFVGFPGFWGIFGDFVRICVGNVRNGGGDVDNTR